jgi:hypothetical protein
VWLDPDGIVYVSTIIRNQNQTAAITKTVAKNEKKPLKIEKGKNYEVVAQGNFNSVLVKENNNLFLLDSKIDGFENYGQSQTFSVSPDGQNLLYCGPSETMISLANPSSDPKRVSLNEKAGIKDCFWINNDYIIFGLTDAVAISEIDIRGNVNIVQFSQKNQNLFFNQQDKKLYILSDRNLLVSEKLIQ